MRLVVPPRLMLRDDAPVATVMCLMMDSAFVEWAFAKVRFAQEQPSCRDETALGPPVLAGMAIAHRCRCTATVTPLHAKEAECVGVRRRAQPSVQEIVAAPRRLLYQVISMSGVVGKTLVMLALFVGLVGGCDDDGGSAGEQLASQMAAAKSLKWDGDNMAKSLATLAAFGEAIDQSKSDGAKDDVLGQARDVYAASAEAGIINPVRAALEAELKKAPEGDQGLKLYLLLADRTRAKSYRKWFTEALIARGTLLGAKQGGAQRSVLDAVIKRYVDLFLAGHARKFEVDAALAEGARDRLAVVGPVQKLYAELVDALELAKYDPSGSDALSNRVYPPISLARMFADRPEVAKVLTGELTVPGPYTAKGFKAVEQGLKDAKTRAERDGWVVPANKVSDRTLARVRQDYLDQYMVEWTRFLRGVKPVVGSDLKEREAALHTLEVPEWPYLRLLRTLEDETQKLGEAGAPIATRFASLVAFGLPRGPTTRLAKYIDALHAFRSQLVLELAIDAAGRALTATDVATTSKLTANLIADTDDFAKSVLDKWLLPPMAL